MNPESAASKISPEKLKKYADFVEVHSDQETSGSSVYNPQRGLTGLLSILTPDLKGIVLASMIDGIIYSTRNQLYRDVLAWLDRLNLNSSMFPIGRTSAWEYCENFETSKGKTEGSLVKIGAVVREVLLHEHLETFGYMRSEVGVELGTPLVYKAIEFVTRARESSVPHRYDSLWRILGSVTSSYDQRRPLTMYTIIEYLVKNPGTHRRDDIMELCKVRNIGKGSLSYAINLLGNAGVIDYESPKIENEGRPGKGYVRYKVDKTEILTKDLDELYREIIERIKYFRQPGYLKRIINYIRDNPNSLFSVQILKSKLPEIPISGITSVITILRQTDFIMREEGGFSSSKVLSHAEANELSKSFYDLVLAPAMAEAVSLTPIHANLPNSEAISIFLENYNEERSMIGPVGGVETREKIIQILTGLGEMKLTHIVQLYNRTNDRQLGSGGIEHQIKKLTSLGIVERTGKSLYKLKIDPEPSSG